MKNSIKNKKIVFISMIFLLIQLVVNFNEYLYCVINIKFPKEEKTVLNFLKDNLDYQKHLKESKDIAIEFAKSTVLVSSLTITFFIWLHFGSTKIEKVVLCIIIPSIISSIRIINMSPIEIFNISSIFNIVSKSLGYAMTQLMLFKICPFLEPGLELFLDLQYLNQSNTFLENIDLSLEYDSVPLEVQDLIKRHNLNVEFYYGTYEEEFFTFVKGSINIIVLGPKDNYFDKNEIKGVMLHEIYHIIDSTVLKKKILKILSASFYFALKMYLIYRLKRTSTTSKQYIRYSIYCFNLFITVFYMLSLIEHYILQGNEEICDLFSKRLNGGKGLASWLLKYNLSDNVPLYHTYLFNLTYYQHPSVHTRLDYLSN
ncbi:hypothetical protein NGRA_0865 [Nosema granulosis]|uniref:Peptidase M48 domain-containing protein n=1 Tax=Nosema granulosis TaxID=83296 RepID=A0A9P6H291_9MICR|nr:hypothetical protein NGRA_0865 [Nosema granulosis]